MIEILRGYILEASSDLNGQWYDQATAGAFGTRLDYGDVIKLHSL